MLLAASPSVRGFFWVLMVCALLLCGVLQIAWRRWTLSPARIHLLFSCSPWKANVNLGMLGMHGLDASDGCVTAVVLRSVVDDGGHTALYWTRKEEEESRKGVGPVSRTYYISRDSEGHGEGAAQVTD